MRKQSEDKNRQISQSLIENFAEIREQLIKNNVEMMGDYNKRLEAIADKMNSFQVEMIEKVNEAKESSLKVLLTGGNIGNTGPKGASTETILGNMREERTKSSSLQAQIDLLEK